MELLKALILGAAIWLSYVTVMSSLQVSIHPNQYSDKSKDLTTPELLSAALWAVFYYLG